CGYGSSEQLFLGLTNYGSNPIDSFKVFYQLDSLSLDSETVIASIDTLAKYKHISQLTFDLSQQKTYTLKTWVKVSGDTNRLNDTLYQKFSNSGTYSPLSIPFSENFDGFSNGSANQNGWNADPISQNANSFGWRAKSGSTASPNTGPAGDHTNGMGKYIYLESSGNGNNGVFESPCINFNQTKGAILSFWYHRYGGTVQPLHIDYYDGKNWKRLETITQKPQTAGTSPWTYHEVFLPFGGTSTKIRFRVDINVCCTGDMAIDDVEKIGRA